jgi:hypothetical protein
MHQKFIHVISLDQRHRLPYHNGYDDKCSLAPVRRGRKTEKFGLERKTYFQGAGELPGREFCVENFAKQGGALAMVSETENSGGN